MTEDDVRFRKCPRQVGHVRRQGGQPIGIERAARMIDQQARADLHDDASRTRDRSPLVHDAQPERLAAFHLWKGRALDALGRRSEAVTEYKAARTGDPNVKRAAAKNETTRYKPRAPAIEWSFGDVISP